MEQDNSGIPTRAGSFIYTAKQIFITGKHVDTWTRFQFLTYT